MPGQLADSLARLRRDHVDLYQHHFPSRRVDIPRLMNLMADAVAAGQVRAVGVSNYSADQMREAHAALAQRGIPLASNQVEYSLLHRHQRATGYSIPAVSSASPSSLTSRWPAARSPASTPRPTGRAV